MKEHPIIFNGEMVRAILAGRKTQTRRVIRLPNWATSITTMSDGVDTSVAYQDHDLQYAHVVNCRWRPGDTLWVRETWQELRYTAFYAADESLPPEGWPEGRWNDRWRPSIFMPRRVSRLTLEVLSVRVERVQDITAADCIAEGIGDPSYDHEIYGSCLGDIAGGCGACQNCDPQPYFRRLWDSINAKRDFGWDTNPWVWVIEFRMKEE